MIALDTNILVRHITQDDREQAARASKLIEKYAHKKASLFINNIVLCEFVWVLGKGYKYSASEIERVLRYMLTAEEFSFERRDILWESLGEFADTNQDFSDILIGKINRLGYFCKTTFTLDKRASSLKEFELL